MMSDLFALLQTPLWWTRAGSVENNKTPVNENEIGEPCSKHKGHEDCVQNFIGKTDEN